MMDNKIIRWIGWMGCVLLLASCKSGDEYEAALPRDAALVVSFNPVSIVEKSGLSGEEGKAKVQRLGDALKSGMQGSGQLVDKVMENPSEKYRRIKKMPCRTQSGMAFFIDLP